MIKAIIEDGSGNGHLAKVTEFGQIVTSPIAYSEASVQAMSVINTAYNFNEPQAGKQIVITGFVIGANNNVSNTTGAIIELYEATAIDSTIISKELFTVNLIKNQVLSLVGLNLITNEGVWLNAKTDDATVNMTVLAYYV
jgi:hypothetical protein